MHVTQACLENVSPSKFWYLSDLYLDLVSRLHNQIGLMGNLCLTVGIPEGSPCFICKENTETAFQNFIECHPFGDNYSSLWSDLKTKIINFNQTDGITMSDLITNLDPHNKVLLLLGGLSLPFDDASVVLIMRFVASAVGKIHNCEQRSYVSLRHHGLINNFCNPYYCKPFQFLVLKNGEFFLLSK